MTTTQRIVIAGGGLAAIAAARELRTQGYEGTIALIGKEPHPPYHRPPLSKDYLAGSAERESVFVRTPEWYEENAVELLTATTVFGVDPRAREVTVSGGKVLGYDKLLLATGSSPRLLTIDGAELQGVHYLRTLDDSSALRGQLAAGGRQVVVIGAGWIGMEVGATARARGNEVTILDRDAAPLVSAIGTELGGYFARLHEEHGVSIRRSVTVESILGDGRRVSGVRLDTGETLPADLVVIGVGVVPNTSLAEDSGLVVGNGIAVDQSLRTNNPDIFAAGDIADLLHPLIDRRVRSEHWANAYDGGKAVARSMLGKPTSFDKVPYFFTKQFDTELEFSGFAALMTDAALVVRGRLEEGRFVAFWLRGAHVVAGANVGAGKVVPEIERLIASGIEVDPARLRDESVPLEKLATAPAAR